MRAARLIGLIIAALAVGILIGRSTLAPLSSAAMMRQRQIDAGLDRVVTKIDFNKTPLDDAIGYLRNQTHANISVDWHALESAGIDSKTPITLKLSGVPLSTALSHAVKIAGGGTVHLAYFSNNGVICINAWDSIPVEARVYDVRDLIQADVDLRSRIARAGTAHNLSTFSLPPGTGDPYKDASNALSAAVDAINPVWDGSPSLVLGGKLVVVKNPLVQKEVEIFLSELRKD